MSGRRRAALVLVGLPLPAAAGAQDAGGGVGRLGPNSARRDTLLAPDTAGAGVVAAALARPRLARVRDRGPGPAGRLLADALGRPHLLLVSPDTGLTLGHDVRVDRPLVVVGGPVRLAATVRGDVIVVGELYLRPGADVDGRAVAVGAGAYGSTLARVRGGVLAYRDVGFAASPRPDGVLALDARILDPRRASRFEFPGLQGLRLPTYDRVNGLSLALGPEIALDTGRVRVEPVVTYRSQLGVVDAGVRAVAELTRRTVLTLSAERGTFTNDAWARTDLVNTVVFAGAGRDARNYFRADRQELTAARRYETRAGVLEPLVGVLTERSASATRTVGSSRPFTLYDRDDGRDGARRPNPAVTGGRITSALVGARGERTTGGVRGRAEVRVEQALAVERAGRFTRANLDVALERGEPGQRQWAFFGHAALTAGRDVPTQRYAYLGGGPTLPTLPLLEQGGNELVWGEARYTVPAPRLQLPTLGPAAFTVRTMLGAAGVNTLPALTPNVGLRLAFGPVRGDVVFDPTGRTRGPQVSLGVGLR